MLSRRQFIRFGGAAAVSVAAYGCSADGSRRGASPTEPSTAQTTTSSTETGPKATTAPSTTGAPAMGLPAPDPAGSRTLVIVQLNGGNDALNTLVPSDGRYRDARPTLAIAEDRLVSLSGVDRWSLHPSLAPLTPLFDAGAVSFLPGIGFPDPDRSHFVSLDRWWRADDLTSSTGWLGRAVAGDAAGVVSPLYATALGSGAPLLRSDAFQPAVVLQPASFVFPDALSADVLARLTDPSSPDALTALAQRSLTDTVAAVAAFSGLLDPDDASVDELATREGGFDLATGLDLAARIVTGDVGAQIVVVSVGGFDTHSNQAEQHAALLADLAAGIESFIATVAAAGLADQTLLVTTSEFGRRIGENASGGCDHGAGGLSMMIGPMVRGGVVSDIDLGDPLDGDVRPSLDPRTMYTACLDWLGLDPVEVLGRRFDEVPLLR